MNTQVTEAMAGALVVGEQVRFVTGGQPVDDNPEREINGKVIRIERKTALPGTLFNKEQVVVEVDPEDGGGAFHLYTWDGLLRYGGGAQVVRVNSGG